MIKNPFFITESPHRLIKLHVSSLISLFHVVQESGLVVVAKLVGAEGAEIGHKLDWVYLKVSAGLARVQ